VRGGPGDRFAVGRTRAARAPDPARFPRGTGERTAPVAGRPRAPAPGPRPLPGRAVPARAPRRATPRAGCERGESAPS